MTGNLVTARNILDGVREGRLDVGPLDAYWHLLIARHAPELTAGIRVLDLDAAHAHAAVRDRSRGTACDGAAPARSLHAGTSPGMVCAVARSHCCWRASSQPAQAAFAPLLDWEREATAAGFAVPA